MAAIVYLLHYHNFFEILLASSNSPTLNADSDTVWKPKVEVLLVCTPDLHQTNIIA
jgi:hypothetical protein